MARHEGLVARDERLRDARGVRTGQPHDADAASAGRRGDCDDGVTGRKHKFISRGDAEAAEKKVNGTHLNYLKVFSAPSAPPREKGR
jgi:hypothetical protein